MRAIVMKEFGPPSVLRIADQPEPVPGPNQVTIEVAYSSVTFIETQVRAGNSPFGNPPLPRIPGNGVGGTIVATGPGVDESILGTNVVATTGGTGGYAERALAKLSDVVTLPKGIAIKDAVALLADGRTALMLFRQADIKPGERVLVEAAAGGVGSLLVQLAIDRGAVVVGASGSAQKEQVVRSLGGHYVDYSAPDWGETARTVLRQQDGISAFDVVFDGVGGQVGTEASKLLRPGGRISLYGIASGSETNLSESPSIQVMGLSTAPSASETFSYIEQVLELAVSGKIRPVIGQIFPLADAALAHAAIEARTTVGKTLLFSKQPGVS